MRRLHHLNHNGCISKIIIFQHTPPAVGAPVHVASDPGLGWYRQILAGRTDFCLWLSALFLGAVAQRNSILRAADALVNICKSCGGSRPGFMSPVVGLGGFVVLYSVFHVSDVGVHPQRTLSRMEYTCSVRTHFSIPLQINPSHQLYHRKQLLISHFTPLSPSSFIPYPSIPLYHHNLRILSQSAYI